MRVGAVQQILENQSHIFTRVSSASCPTWSLQLSHDWHKGWIGGHRDSQMVRYSALIHLSRFWFLADTFIAYALEIFSFIYIGFSLSILLCWISILHQFSLYHVLLQPSLLPKIKTKKIIRVKLLSPVYRGKERTCIWVIKPLEKWLALVVQSLITIQKVLSPLVL